MCHLIKYPCFDEDVSYLPTSNIEKQIYSAQTKCHVCVEVCRNSDAFVLNWKRLFASTSSLALKYLHINH